MLNEICAQMISLERGIPVHRYDRYVTLATLPNICRGFVCVLLSVCVCLCVSTDRQVGIHAHAHKDGGKREKECFLL